MKTIDETLTEREKTHGSFIPQANCTQNLKQVLYYTEGWDCVPHYMKEAIHVILHKIARIVSGSPHEPDHWHDIQGYARLIERELLKEDQVLPGIDPQTLPPDLTDQEIEQLREIDPNFVP